MIRAPTIIGTASAAILLPNSILGCQRADQQRRERAPELPGSPHQAFAQLQGGVLSGLAVVDGGVVHEVELTPILVGDPHPRGLEATDRERRLADGFGDVSEAEAA